MDLFTLHIYTYRGRDEASLLPSPPPYVTLTRPDLDRPSEHQVRACLLGPGREGEARGTPECGCSAPTRHLLGPPCSLLPPIYSPSPNPKPNQTKPIRSNPIQSDPTTPSPQTTNYHRQNQNHCRRLIYFTMARRRRAGRGREGGRYPPPVCTCYPRTIPKTSPPGGLAEPGGKET